MRQKTGATPMSYLQKPNKRQPIVDLCVQDLDRMGKENVDAAKIATDALPNHHISKHSADFAQKFVNFTRIIHILLESEISYLQWKKISNLVGDRGMQSWPAEEENLQILGQDSC